MSLDHNLDASKSITSVTYLNNIRVQAFMPHNCRTMPSVVRTGESVLWVCELIGSTYLNWLITEFSIHCMLCGIGGPNLLKKQKLRSTGIEKLSEIEGIPVETLYIKSY